MWTVPPRRSYNLTYLARPDCVTAGRVVQTHMSLSPATRIVATIGSGSVNITHLGYFSCTHLSLRAGASDTENVNQITEYDRILVGASVNRVAGETAGCVLSYDITTGFPFGISLAVPPPHTAEPAGISGIIVENVADESTETKLTTDIYSPRAQTGGVGQSCNKYSSDTVSGNYAVNFTQSVLR